MGLAHYCELKHPGDFYLPRSIAEVTLPQLVANWFMQIDSVLVPSQLAVSTLNSQGLWLHVKFLSLIQVLEGFHRGRFPGEYTSAAQYEPVKKSLTDAIPGSLTSDHRAALKSKIHYGNQLSLGRRLSELASLVGTDVSLQLFGFSSKVPRTWIDTRNYHTHWDSELLPKTIQGQALYNATIRMEHFVRALFILLMGVGANHYLKALNHTSRRAQQLAHVNITERHQADPSQPKGILFTVRTGPAPVDPVEPSEDTGESTPRADA